MPLRATFVTTTAVVLAGMAWAAPARAAAPTTDFEVCGQRGCVAQRAEGTITWGPRGSIVGTAIDRGPGGTKVVLTISTPSGRVTEPILVDEGRKPFSITVANPTSVTVSVCTAPITTFPCVSETYTP
ncbi:hypothetical protein DMH04_48895 [Kibdelosporangium aridum]|uniref:Uncharacterized protein n=1 Tax=Kibdelosporangium aridum TaxID=2030 RepID=A0A428YIU2_KIBAR|nr:hypothetical protein [Kibdelosporangium aridum]RSM67514.1 hypothetical protein DMH04_48895 [Kibdelosporangium aridum]